MVLTINPAVSGGTHRWLRNWLAFFGGATVGALVTATVSLLMFAAVAFVLSPRGAVVSLTAIILYAALCDIGLPLPLPYRNAQVPEWLRDALPLPIVAATYGALLGSGFLTLFTYSSHLAAFAALPMLKSTAEIMVVVGSFALGKSVVLAWAIGAESLDEVEARVTLNPRSVSALRAANAVVSAFVAWSVFWAL